MKPICDSWVTPDFSLIFRETLTHLMQVLRPMKNLCCSLTLYCLQVVLKSILARIDSKSLAITDNKEVPL